MKTSNGLVVREGARNGTLDISDRTQVEGDTGEVIRDSVSGESSDFVGEGIRILQTE